MQYFGVYVVVFIDLGLILHVNHCLIATATSTVSLECPRHISPKRDNKG